MTCIILLITTMFYRTYYSQNVFGERDVLQPHNGEIVASFYPPEESWCRALVLDKSEDKFKVSVFTVLTKVVVSKVAVVD